MKKIGAQGEVNVWRLDALPEMQTKSVDKDMRGRPIISHSESGSHHVIDGTVDVLERTTDVPAGMRILYAILEDPTALVQDAASAHETIPLEPGIYEFRIAREYDPFAEQARIVAD